MKLRIGKVISLALCVTALVTLAIALGVHHTRRAKPMRLNAPSQLKQIGLAFRQEHNSPNGQITITGQVVAPRPAPPSR